MNLINQIDDKSCVVACVAMVTDVPFDDVMAIAREFGYSVPMSVDDTNRLLVRLMRYPKIIHSNELRSDKIYIASVPSLNLPGFSHSVVLDTRFNPIEVLDPQNGRRDRKFYVRGGINGDISECAIDTYAHELHVWYNLVEVCEL